MSEITYEVLKHERGWTSEASGTYSAPFLTREAARKAANVAASEQATPAETTTQIGYDDKNGR
jgi:hypothetical protein